MKPYNRIIVILILAVLTGYLAHLKIPHVQIAAIIGPLTALAASYIAIKGKGSGQ